MVKRKHIEKTQQEMYYDGEADYIDERFVSKEMKLGVNDCSKYLEQNDLDNEVYWLKSNANSGAYYREPSQGQSSFENTYE